MKNKFKYYQNALERRQQQNHYRQLRCVVPLDEAHILREGRRLIHFSSNDSLGLSRHPYIKKNTIKYVLKWGAGSTPSRLMTGHLLFHKQIEEQLAKLLGQEAALLFPSGYQANQAILSAIANPKSLIFIDRFCHPSLITGAQNSGGKLIRFEHNDLYDLELALDTHKNTPAQSRIIITESLFQHEGDKAPLKKMAHLADEYEALFYVDDALSVGLFGPNGMGYASHYPGIDFTMGTFSKACGSFGGYIGLSKTMKEYLLNFCPIFHSTSALPPAILGAIEGALELIPDMEAERDELKQKSKWLRTRLQEIGWNIGEASAHIIPLIVHKEETAQTLFDTLCQEGILASLIKTPLVPPNSARIRLSLSVNHTDDQLSKLLNTLQNRQHRAKREFSLT